jgi:hypothetical protein
MKKLRLAVLAGIALLAAPIAAMAAGDWATLPVVGGAPFCASNVTGTGGPTAPYLVTPANPQGTTQGICGQTVPAGPPDTSGIMTLPVDTNLAGGASPQTAVVPLVLLGSINVKENRIIGGDFATNAWQRGTTPVSGASPTTYVMSADRWFAISASNVMTVSKVTPAATAADYLGNVGLNSWMRVARPSGTPSGTSCVGQVLDQEQSQQLIGSNAVFSFYGYAPATFSAANSAITVSVAYYTATDSATPGTNTATFALSGSGQSSGIAGYTANVAGFSLGTTGSIASGVATIDLSTTPTRYAVYAPIPAANASGTQVIGVGVTLCDTPTLTTTVATDYFEIEGAQLQGLPSAVANNLPNGVITPTGFERRPIPIEQALEYYYSWGLKEPAAGTLTSGVPVLCSATANALIGIALPETMRAIPALTLTAGGWKIQTAVAQTAIGTTTLVSGSTAQQVTLTSAAACTSTLPYQLVGTGTTGLLMFSAEP